MFERARPRPVLLLSAQLTLVTALTPSPAQPTLPTQAAAPSPTASTPAEGVVCGPTSPPPGGVHGCVQAPSGYRISHVEIGLRRSGETVATVTVQTDSAGNFSFSGEDLDQVAPAAERMELVATYPGFDPIFRTLERGAIDPLTLEMNVSTVQESITVEAISPTDPAQQSNQEFGFLDIVATAGANADPLFATQTLPGVVKLDEGSGLFVRGGDASEVATFLDRALLDHPYRNETPTGGFFGTVDAFQLEGLSLAAGGFPARYGNTLSAVLELRTRPRGTIRGWNLGIGLANLSASFETEIGDHLAFRAAANHRDSRALVEFNNADLDFPEEPLSSDLNTRWLFERNERERLTVAATWNTASVGTEIEDGNFVGLIDTADDNTWWTGTWSRTFGDGSTLLDVTASWADHRSELSAGVLDIDQADDTARLRVDGEHALAFERSGSAFGHLLAGATLRAGGVAERRGYDSRGFLPEVGGDFGGQQGLVLWTNDAVLERRGAYFELEQSIGSRFAFNVGARFDDHPLLDEASVDPRLALTVRTGGAESTSNVRVAWGIYRQSPAIQYLAQPEGRPDLALMEAEHRIVAWQLGAGRRPFDLRIELYDKRYEQLPFQRFVETGSDRALRFTSTGFGHARGGDFYVGWRARRTAGLRGWLAYTYLDAERLFTPWQDDARFPVPEVPFSPDFAIPHTLQLVGNAELPFDIDASLGFRWATGRPFTPVVDAVETNFGFQPIYGEINSERVDDYLRVDASFSRAFVFGASTAAIAFVGINDLFDRRNTFRVVYSPDYSQERDARTAFGRTVYFGISLSR